jgi:UDP-glucose 4-epimerase
MAEDNLITPMHAMEEQLAGRHVLVTGATGFIGSHLVGKLAELGAQVTAVGPALGWRPIVPKLVEQGRVRFVKLGAFWSPTSLRRVMYEFKEVDHVVHLGYVMPRGSTSLESALEELYRNVIGTLRLMQILPRMVSTVCFASSAMVYGLEPSLPVSETDCARPASVYAAGKLAAEMYLRLWAEKSGVALFILRYATVYGSMETVPRAIPNFIRQVLAEGSPVIHGSGDDIRDYVHVDDVIDATLLALTHEGRGARIYLSLIHI